MASVVGTANWTDNANDKSVTVPAGTDTVVFVGAINDGDGAHTAVDGNFTFNGTTMADALSGVSTSGRLNNGNYNGYIYILKNYTGGTGSKTMHHGIHGGFGTSDFTVIFISGGDSTTQPDGSPAASLTTGANPSDSVSPTTTSDILIEVLACGNTPTAASSQTVVGSSDTNLRSAYKASSSTGSQSLAWTMSSAQYIHGVIAVKGSGGGGAVTYDAINMAGD